MKYRIAAVVAVGLIAWRLRALSLELSDVQHQMLKDESLVDVGEVGTIDLEGREVLGMC